MCRTGKEKSQGKVKEKFRRGKQKEYTLNKEDVNRWLTQ